MTYSTSAQVRNTLLENKFYVGKIYDKKTNRVIGTIASKDSFEEFINTKQKLNIR